MTKLGLTALAMFVLVAPAASAAGTYRDPDEGVQVKVKRGKATVRFTDPACGAGVLKAKVQEKRIAKSTEVDCEPSAEASSKTVRVEAKVKRRRVVGTVDDRPFRARRGAAAPSTAQRCKHRGLTIAETEAVRVFEASEAAPESNPRDDLLIRTTVACRRRDGEAVEIARVEPHDPALDGTDEEGTRARRIQVAGSLLAFRHAAFNASAEKNQQADQPSFDPTVVLRDLEAGTESRIDPELKGVDAVALHPDGRIAWAGTERRDPHGEFDGDKPFGPPYGSGDEVYVKSGREGEVMTLDFGPIIASSLRAEGDGFDWDRR